MNRHLPLTPAEAGKFAALAVGESMWIARDGVPFVSMEGRHSRYDAPDVLNVPPVEFVQACAPCPIDCADGVLSAVLGMRGTMPCPACRIQLVGPCPDCEGRGWVVERRTYGQPEGEQVQCSCDDGTVTLGYVYSVGEPLPMVGYLPTPPHRDCVEVGNDGMIVWRREPGAYGGQAWRATHHPAAALAHYGPPESLVGQWAIEARKAVAS